MCPYHFEAFLCFEKIELPAEKGMATVFKSSNTITLRWPIASFILVQPSKSQIGNFVTRFMVAGDVTKLLRCLLHLFVFFGKLQMLRKRLDSWFFYSPKPYTWKMIHNRPKNLNKKFLIIFSESDKVLSNFSNFSEIFCLLELCRHFFQVN